MTEEFLVLGRPPRPPRRGRWNGRAPRAIVGVLVLALLGWALWHGIVEQPAGTPRGDATTPTPSVPSSTETGFVAHEPPTIPYLRSGTLVEPGGVRGIPDGSWTNFALLKDGRLVLVQQADVTVIGPGRQRRNYELTGGISARPDGTEVAWTGRDGRVRRLRTGQTEPTVERRDRQLVPTCRGLVVGGRPEPGWETCDQDGNLLSPDGNYFASIGSVSVTLAPRADITSGVSVAFLGSVLDAVWEDPYHLLVVMGIADEAHLMRIGVGGESEDLVSLTGATDPHRPVLVLPAPGTRGS